MDERRIEKHPGEPDTCTRGAIMNILTSADSIGRSGVLPMDDWEKGHRINTRDMDDDGGKAHVRTIGWRQTQSYLPARESDAILLKFAAP